MSEFWAGQIENLETTAEIFFRLVDEKEGSDPKHPEYKHLRATRLQLRFAQDLVTVVQFFLDKEQKEYAKNHTPKVRDGGVVRHFSEFTDRSAESIASNASQDDFTRLSAVVRRLGFGPPSGLQ